jgi:hypothetical protein
MANLNTPRLDQRPWHLTPWRATPPEEAQVGRPPSDERFPVENIEIAVGPAPGGEGDRPPLGPRRGGWGSERCLLACSSVFRWACSPTGRRG